jgi:hypothetical protein
MKERSAMANQLRIWWDRFRCCGTGYEILAGTATVTYNATGASPLTITCPAGKYLLDRVPDFGSFQVFMNFNGTLTMTTLPDGRTLPTGWSGDVYQTMFSTVPTAKLDFTARCIYA